MCLQYLLASMKLVLNIYAYILSLASLIYYCQILPNTAFSSPAYSREKRLCLHQMY